MTNLLPHPRRTTASQPHKESSIQNYLDIVDELLRKEEFTPELKKPVRSVNDARG